MSSRLSKNETRAILIGARGLCACVSASGERHTASAINNHRNNKNKYKTKHKSTHAPSMTKCLQCMKKNPTSPRNPSSVLHRRVRTVLAFFDPHSMPPWSPSGPLDRW